MEPVYVILTTKPGVFRTEAGDGADIIETYDYVFYGRALAVFSIALLHRDIKLVVTEETPPYVVNHVPSKFLERFASVDAARKELAHLTRFGSMESTLTLRSGAVAAEH
ncbi:ferredoxin [Achromobacter deleyi]|uniref:ferredoxin n=1 Tax=Achromobacter deleyi TaxID=1353891 RepID=UPI001491600F|nr:ferredoxin [Achromobacter deleyi]QVQ25185.1 ferredoxin [Achromobacter deleyi]UIP20726.1 ferredoxin [Achromobacter deleyi]